MAFNNKEVEISDIDKIKKNNAIMYDINEILDKMLSWYF
jgi:hypothetical protein